MKKTVFAGKPPRLSSFDLSHEHKLTCHMGDLLPILCTEVMPGDTLSLNSDMFLRLMPLVAPMMHRVECYLHYFFVPTRLVWDNWDKFLTGGPDGNATYEYPHYELDFNDETAVGKLGLRSLYDYFGLPPAKLGVAYPSFSTLPLRAYNLVYNEWYRDETLVDEVPVPTSDGTVDEDLDNYLIRKRAWSKGYFESALPWTQRGPMAQLPIDPQAVDFVPGVGTRVNLARGQDEDNRLTNYGNGYGAGSAGADPRMLVHPVTQGGNAYWQSTDGTTTGATRSDSVGGVVGSSDAYGAGNSLFGGPNWTGLVTRETTGISLNSLRLATAVQHFYERNARGGVRYIEFLRSHFGVKSSDARLQRPEYLGGGKSPIVIGEVLQNSQSDVTPQGWMAGQAVSAQRSLGFHRSFEEFGYVLGLLSIRPVATYEQGVQKLWRRFGRFDQILPEFAGIGDQAVKMSELYAYADNPDSDFGYVPRYEECRRLPSTVHGEFRNDGGTLGYWHMGRYFESAPQLTSEFVECDPTNRVFAVQDGSDECLVDISHNIRALRPLPLNGVPGLRSL